MNAIDLLQKQHRDVEELFGELEGASAGAAETRERLCREISDNLAVHAEIEERILYPEARQENTEKVLRESVEEHLSMKRLLAEIIEDGVEHENFDARMRVLEEQVGHHIEEEERRLFPKVRKACSEEELEDLGLRMEALADELMSAGEPSKRIPGQTDRPAHI